MNSLTSAFLLEDARTKLWCAPIQDRQVILDLTRISRDSGAKVSKTLLWTDTPLPTETGTYHVYQIGNNSSWRTGLPDKRGIWFAMGPWAAANNLIIDLYFDSGVKIPLFSSYVMRTYDDALVVAIKTYPTRWDFLAGKVYLRVYNNAFFRSTRSKDIAVKTWYNGKEITKANEISPLVTEIKEYQRKTGVVNIFHNGVWKPDIKESAVVVGDLLEYVYDAAVSHLVDFKVSGLADFTSTLDSLKKYLLHPPKASHEKQIYYVDDIDIYLYRKETDASLTGRYYNRNKENSLRNITHADYSVPVGYVHASINTGWTSFENVYLRLHIRESGYSRPLIHEVNRIDTLYRLSDRDIVRAMIGLDSTLEEWRVENLENSLYTEIMRSPWADFTATDVINAYGYNGLASLFAFSPKEVTADANGNWVDVDYGLSQCSTIFEYNADGKLVAWGKHGYSERYFTKSQDAALAEGVMGMGTKEIPWSPSNDNVTLDDRFQYYFFTSPINNGVVTGAWVPAVKGTHYTVSTTGVVTWIHVKARNMGLVLSSQYNLIYDQPVSTSDGIYRFTLTYGKTLGNVLPISPQQLRVWMNGRALIEGLDYKLNGNVGTLITNRYTDDSKTSQNFTFCCLGWETPTRKRKSPGNIGFTVQGYVSKNGKYDLRDDKVIRVVVDGYVLENSKVPFIEDADEKEIPLLPNGLAYSEETTYTPLYGISTEANAELMEMGAASDARVEAYMTLKFPEKELTGPNPISEYYRLFSPTITRLLFDLDTGTITAPTNPNDKIALDRIIAKYTAYLDIDPCRSTWNTNYIRVDPHPFENAVGVPTIVLRFLENVNIYYLNSKLSLTNFFFIKES